MLHEQSFGLPNAEIMTILTFTSAKMLIDQSGAGS